jgi:hypothetical protein
MKKPKQIVCAAALLALGGCIKPSTTNVGSLVLPGSGRAIDVVQHRTDNEGCTTGFVLQTYSQAGELIDSKGGYGTSLGCRTIDGLIRASGQVGAAALIADGIRDSADRTTISNSNSQSQGQAQAQSQYQTAQGGAGGAGGNGGNGGNGNGGGHGNNGGGNGDGDGTNPGTGHHHDNGDGN